ncbi:unnamed protein product [Chilo suppressalis]|uniref:UDP-glucuronosyltransferase n=2 Tax=Chilo suppressalis TaxID=168631 RepID=A0ABN8B7K5_CHISP|nr:unnamed protein product [Chilo suppressalis]
MWMVFFFVCVLHCTVAYKVLVCYPFPAKSMNNLGEGIVRHLLDAGHEVTFITVYPKQVTHPKFRQIDVSGNAALIENDEHVNITYILENSAEVSSDKEFLQELTWKIAVNTFQDANMRRLVEDTQGKFDVVIADLLETELYAGLAVLYDAPLIWSYSMGAHWLAIRMIDDPTNPAYSTDYYASVSPPYSVGQRFQILWQQIMWRYAKYFKYMPKEKNSFKSIFGPLIAKRGRKLPKYEELIYNASLVLSNEHHATGKIPKTPQNWKLVGGYHIQDPPVSLPKDLQVMMDNAKHGVIYFSMGSMWKSEMIPKRLTDELLKMFGGLKETILWKYEADLPHRPKNVHTIKWAPQQSILAHPNCKIFISHGGLLSSTEAIHFGVPIIGIPISYDQYINIEKSVTKGYALKVSLSYNLAKDLKPAIESLIQDTKYKENVKFLSSIYHDRPIPPGKELVHWIEHVVRSRGALHLRSIALDVPFYQKAYLDIIAITITTFTFITCLIKQLFRRKPTKQIKKKVN